MIRALTDAVLAVTLAPACAACGRPLDAPSRGPVCRGCWASIQLLSPPFCGCGDPLPSWRRAEPEAETCMACRTGAARAVRTGRSAAEYTDQMRAILHALKYGGRRAIARPLGRLMRERGSDVLEGADFLTPVPLHWRRQWTRGFNQAAELAGVVGLPVVQALGRIRHTDTQTDLPADRRHANVRRAFRVRQRSAPHVRGACVVLIDDVRTTGATLEACAEALLGAGAREVRTLTSARVVIPPHARRG